VLFERRFWSGIQDGSLTCTFRRWKRPQAVAGRRYRTAAGILEVDAVDIVTVDEVNDADARASGYPDAGALVAELRGDESLPLRRIRFHLVDEPDPRAVLAHDDDLTPDAIAQLDSRLARLDKASSHGPWTREVLALVRDRPGVRAGDLADACGRERLDFKLDVRKLKALGLTESLSVGYRLSPRGAAYLARSASPVNER
jgi:hypothetical protein